jgi:hypothetical protein
VKEQPISERDRRRGFHVFQIVAQVSADIS